MVTRMVAAHNNSLEILPLFAAGVIMCKVGGASDVSFHPLIKTYLASRVVYNVAYIFNTGSLTSYIRTGVFVVGVAACMQMFYVAATKSKL